MTLRTLALTALILGIAGALTVIGPAQAAKYSADARFKTWDPDNDGTIDLAEANKAAGAKFDSLEADHDGTLDRKEMSSTKVDRKTFNKADPDKDGTLTKDEYLTIVKSRFEAADGPRRKFQREFKSKAGKALARLLNGVQRNSPHFGGGWSGGFWGHPLPARSTTHCGSRLLLRSDITVASTARLARTLGSSRLVSGLC